MSPKELFVPKIGGICGIFSPMIALLTILIAISVSPWFSWNNNYLSDLGGNVGDTPIYGAHGVASVIFNIGMFCSGILAIIFAFSFKVNFPVGSRLGRLGKWFLIIYAFGITGVGLFPEPTGAMHGIAAVALFLAIPGSLFFIGMGMLRVKRYNQGLFVTILGIGSFLSLYLLTIERPTGNNAIAEIIPVSFMLVFMVIFGFLLFKKTPQK